MAGTTGLEPAASAVTGQRSNQLNYVPNLRFQLYQNEFVELRSHALREHPKYDDVPSVMFECDDVLNILRH